MSDLSFRTLMRVIQNLPAGTVVFADTWRVEADAAELNTAARGAAPRVAARLGYLEPFSIEVDGVRLLACTASDREKGKGGRVLVYKRTEKVIPDHLCTVSEPGQAVAS